MRISLSKDNGPALGWNSEYVYSAPWNRIFVVRSLESFSWWTITLLLCNEGLGLPLCAFFFWAFGACCCDLRSSGKWRPVSWWLVPVTQWFGNKSQRNGTVYHPVSNGPILETILSRPNPNLSHKFETVCNSSLHTANWAPRLSYTLVDQPQSLLVCCFLFSVLTATGLLMNPQPAVM
jgi:hypothetical protein